MLSEIKVALRGLAKSPGFTIIAIATLTLAIGANSAVFSLINALLVRPLPYQQPSKLALIWEQFATQGLDRIPVSAPEFRDYETQLHSFEKIAAFDYTTFNLATGNLPERIQGADVSPDLFDLLGVQPSRGRPFLPDEQGLGRDDVVVISERIWKRRFNSDPAVLGSKLMLSGHAYTVVGIMPSAFEFPLPLFNVQGGQFGERVEIWKPTAFTEGEMKARGSRNYSVIARLRNGVSASQAQAELDNVIASWRRQYPDNYSSGGFGARIYSLHDQVVGGMRTGLAILLGAVVFVLLIACANLATMLLARASARERELAIRVALGAGRWRLLRQILTESVLLALAGAACGIMLSVWGLELLKHIGARTVPRLAEVNVDLVVLIVTAVAAVGTGILFGLIPAFATAKPELTEALKEGGRSSTTGARRNRVRNSLVVAEISLALVLLVGAGLLMKSFARLQNVNPGLDPHNVLTMEISLPEVKYPAPGPSYMGGETAINFFTEAERRISQLPGVEATGIAAILPLSGSNGDSSFEIENRPHVGAPGPDEEFRVISPGFFRALKVPLLQGRFFNDADTSTSPAVVIVNEALARKYFPNEEALGKRITLDNPRKDPKWITIVGVVGSIRHRALDLDPQPEYYVPNSQFSLRNMVVLVRSKLDPRNLTSAIRSQIQSMDAELPIAHVRTLDEVVADSIAPRWLSVVLLGVFSGIAVLLATVGIYGVISYLVVQRTHEIGVRMALGAQRRDVLRLVVGHAAKLVGIGSVIGLVLALISTRTLSALLYNVGAFDAATFIFVTIALAAVALLASYIPALRATRADPMIALSHNA
jgi:putative ABC transport system permease protein